MIGVSIRSVERRAGVGADERDGDGLIQRQSVVGVLKEDGRGGADLADDAKQDVD